MYDSLQNFVTGTACAVLAGLLVVPLLVGAARRMRRQGLAFVLIAGGFLVSMATKPPADTNLYAVAYSDRGVADAMEPQIVSFNQVTNLAPCTLTPPEGQRFLGWRGSFGSRLYDDGVLIFNLAPRTNRIVTLTAEWAAD